MYLKRHFEPAALAKWQNRRDKFVAAELPELLPHMTEQQATSILRNRFGDENEQPAISHVEVLHASAEWRPSKGIIERGAAEGWLSIVDGMVVLKTAESEPDVRYRIESIEPTLYECAITKEKADA